MAYPDEFIGFQVVDPAKYKEFHKQSFQPKSFGDYDVDIEVECCGICSSDIHTINGGWGQKNFPLTVGHEIVGKVVATGSKVTSVDKGQRVGVGAQVYSCLACDLCKNGNETYCPKQIDTYGARWPESGIVSHGGFANYQRTHEYWVYPIPDAVPSTSAAPMMCAGITTYSPLVRSGTGPGKKIGIVGLGGLGHFGVLWAKALGADVWAISRSHRKEQDAQKLGADGFLAISDEHWTAGHELTFDTIICTSNSFGEGFSLAEYLKLLKVEGKFIFVGLPEESELRITPFMLHSTAVSISATHLGSRKEMLDMLSLAAKKNITAWVEEVPLDKDRLADAVTRLEQHDVRYRFCLTQYNKAFE